MGIEMSTISLKVGDEFLEHERVLLHVHALHAENRSQLARFLYRKSYLEARIGVTVHLVLTDCLRLPCNTKEQPCLPFGDPE